MCKHRGKGGKECGIVEFYQALIMSLKHEDGMNHKWQQYVL